MNKTIKSGVRKLLFCMISKYEEKQQAKEAEFLQKQDCLRIVVDFLANQKEVSGVAEIMRAIERLTDSEQKDRVKAQNQFLEEISSLTEVSITTLKRIKKEGVVNEGVWSTPGKKRPHQSTVSNLDSFDMDAIRNKIKQVPKLRTSMAELKECIVY